jgi:hypothetical protein
MNETSKKAVRILTNCDFRHQFGVLAIRVWILFKN